MDKSAMLEFFFNNNSFNALVQEISAMFHCPIVITDNAFHIICSVSSMEYEDPIYQTAISHSKLSEDTCIKIGNMVEAGQNHFRVKSGENDLCVGILKNSEAIIGYVLYLIDTDAADIRDLFFCEGMIAKQLFLERYCTSTSISTAEEILTDLLNGEYTSEKIFNMQIAGTFLSHFSAKRFAVISFSNMHDFDEKHITVLQRCKDCFHASHPFIYKNKIIIFLHKDHSQQEIKNIAHSLNLNVIVSDELDRLFNMNKHYARMCSIEDYLCKKNKTSYVVSEHAFSIITFLMQLKQNDFRIDNKISALLKHDLKNNTEFCLTLYIYIICNHSLKKTAENLHTHSNTVLYRIQKAKEEFEIDTDNPELHFYYLISLSISLLELGYDELFIL